MSHCQNVCGRTVPDGYRLCPTCQAGANERVQTVRAELEKNCDQLRAENERLRNEAQQVRCYLRGCMNHAYDETPLLQVAKDVSGGFHRNRYQIQTLGIKLTEDCVENERLRSIYADASEALLYITAYILGETLQEPYPAVGLYAEFDTVRAEIDALRDELQAANLTIEARSARLAEARAELADLRAVAAIVFLRNTQPELDEMITRYRTRWQSGEKEDES